MTHFALPKTPAAAGLEKAGQFLFITLLLDLLLSPVPVSWFIDYYEIYKFIMLVSPTVGLVMYLGVASGMVQFADAAAASSWASGEGQASPRTAEAPARQIAIACYVGAGCQGLYLFVLGSWVLFDAILFNSEYFYQGAYIVSQLAFAAVILLLVKICREESRALSRNDLVGFSSWLYPVLAVAILGFAFVHHDILMESPGGFELSWYFAAGRFVVLLGLVHLIRKVVRAMQSGSTVPAAVVRSS